ncbi:E3 ubiquitin/ISG15 ligase TRIM25-like [Haplochromis burtoni]|uniref:E3 ubiquitin/ISG15 ligase TRIM25-like n=1 Tax=Haplochromis burtoni TaxID=8153 RepID=UPI0003BC5905|nr:E3 ubiquitin/ISG15 ligase TRIM25-like [Haplochromis burtoni]
MEQQHIQVEKKKLCCSICLDLLKDPVTIPCGHSYCTNCVKHHWDEEDHKKTHSCPQCRQTFTPRPALVKNTVLAELVEELQTTELQADHCYAGPGDVTFDVCSGRKLKATKSCLERLVSYCGQHFHPHYESPAYKKHKLIKQSGKLQGNICSCHGKDLKLFCRTDQKCTCLLCAVYEHKHHGMILASEERSKWEGELVSSQQKIKKRIQDRENDMKVLQHEMDAINYSTDKALKESEEIFTQLLHLINNMRSDVKLQIKSQQKTKVSRAKELRAKLQQELRWLRRRDAELEQLSHRKDHATFIQNYSSLTCINQGTDPRRINMHLLQYFEDVTLAAHKAKEKLHAIFTDTSTKISLIEKEVSVSVPSGEPKTRAECLQHSQVLTLDPNTANTHLSLSEGNRKATVMSEKQLYPSHQDRFTDMFQVLSRESLSGRHYWEVEKKSFEVSIAVTYKDIRRTGYESGFGNDDKSWALECFHNSYQFRHNATSTLIRGPQSSRIGVYLDHSGGILSFYSVSDTVNLLHRVQTTFTQPLYQGLGVFASSDAPAAAAELCELKTILVPVSPV